MYKLSDVIEALGTPMPGIAKFNKYQVYAIQKALATKGGARMTFNLTKNKNVGLNVILDVKAKIIPGSYPKLELEYIAPSYDRVNIKGQFYVSDNGISSGICLGTLTPDSRTCKLVSFEYNPDKDKTVMKFDLKGHELNSSWDHIYGRLTLTLKGNCVDPEPADLKFDGKRFVAYMQEYLPAKREYLRSFDWDSEILDCYAEYRKDKKELYIELYLECGKGYSVHHRSEDYCFEHDGIQYRSIDRHQYYDRDSEAQIIRKFKSGVQEYIGTRSCPRYLTIHVEQELD